MTTNTNYICFPRQQKTTFAPLVKHVEVPEPHVLKQLDWSQGVLTTYERLLADNPTAAINYLVLQWRMDFDPTYARSVRLPQEPEVRQRWKAITEAIITLLHPYQQPLSVGAIQVELSAFGFRYCESKPLQSTCLRLLHADRLSRFRNPFKGNQFVYCSPEYKAQPEVGDRVIELLRGASRRSGVVERFKVYRMNGQLYPVARWDAIDQSLSFSSFANPEMLVVVEKPEPFTSTAKNHQRVAA